MYRIGELAARIGVTTPTLRYYEDIGLLESSKRSPAGYRLYDEAAEGRLQFIARAKRLGLSLDEIGDVVQIWDGRNCSATRAHLRHLVAHKDRGDPRAGRGARDFRTPTRGRLRAHRRGGLFAAMRRRVRLCSRPSRAAKDRTDRRGCN